MRSILDPCTYPVIQMWSGALCPLSFVIPRIYRKISPSPSSYRQSREQNRWKILYFVITWDRMTHLVKFANRIKLHLPPHQASETDHRVWETAPRQKREYLRTCQPSRCSSPQSSSPSHKPRRSPAQPEPRVLSFNMIRLHWNYNASSEKSECH